MCAWSDDPICRAPRQSPGGVLAFGRSTPVYEALFDLKGFVAFLYKIADMGPHLKVPFTTYPVIPA